MAKKVRVIIESLAERLGPKVLFEKGENTGKILEDYNIYEMSLAEKLVYLLIAASVIYFSVYIFYRSHILSALICPLSLLYIKPRAKELALKRKSLLNLQFKDMLYLLSSSISAGKSVELALKDVLTDLQILYPDDEADIIKEVLYMQSMLEMNRPIEAVFDDFARRTDIEDIKSFADVFHICKRSGGNLIEVIKNTSDIINDKMEIKQEIETLIAQRKLERRILNVMPVALILVLSLSAPDYINPIYETAAGRAAMSVSLLFIFLSWFISKKVMDIRI